MHNTILLTYNEDVYFRINSIPFGEPNSCRMFNLSYITEVHSHFNQTNSSRNMTVTDAPPRVPSATIPTVVTVIIMSVAVWIIVTNTMIICAPFVNKNIRKKTKTYIFLSSLAVADIFTAFSLPFTWMIFYLKFVNQSLFITLATEILCKLRMVLLGFPLVCSTCNLFLISLDRFIAIVFQLKYLASVTKKVAHICCVFAWIFSVVIATLIVYVNPYHDNKGAKCTIKDFPPLGVHLFAGTLFWVVALLMLMIYIKVYLVVRKSCRASMKGCRQSNIVTEKNMAKMVFISFGTFLACWGPFIIIFQLYVENKIHSSVFNVLFITSYLNSGLNFLIYAKRSTKYRAAFRKMCYLCRKQQQDKSINLGSDNSTSGRTNITNEQSV